LLLHIISAGRDDVQQQEQRSVLVSVAQALFLLFFAAEN
jgi:hypothetical protein